MTPQPQPEKQARQEIAFTVYGTPRPQGSTRAFFVKKLGRSIITSDNAKLKPWRQAISETALAMDFVGFGKGTPVAIGLQFFFEKPKSVPRSRKRPTVKPDTDKLIRAVLDALTGIVYADDAQVVDFTVSKFYGTPERVEICVSAAEKPLDLPQGLRLFTEAV